MRRAVLVLSCVLLAAPAFGQSAYVVGSINAEISRMSRAESSGFEFPGGDGEVLGGSLRVGTALSDRWGLELEFARGAEVEDETTIGPRILPAPPISFTSTGGVTFGGGVLVGPELAPIRLSSTLRVRRSNPTLGTTAWIRQSVSDSVDLVYSGGLAFTRSATEQESSFSFTLPPGLVVPSQVTRTTLYSVGPLVGMDAQIQLTDHVRLVPGIRLKALDDAGTGSGNGWLARAGVGLGWFF
jgi:hypothetical protein